MKSLTWRRIPGSILGALSCPDPVRGTVIIKKVRFTPDERLWIELGVDGLVYYQDQKWVWLPELKDQRFTWFQGHIWTTGKDNMLYIFNSESWQKIFVPFEQTRYLFTDHQERMWAAPSEGLWMSNDGIDWHQISLPHPRLSVELMWIDGLDTVWLKFYHDSTLYTLENNKLISCRLPNAIRNPSSLCNIVRNHKGDLLMATSTRGLWIHNNNHWYMAPEAKDLTMTGIIPGVINDIVVDSTQHIWLGVDASLYCYINDEWRTLLIQIADTSGQTIHIIRPFPIASLTTDHHGRLWIGGNYGVVAWIDMAAPLEAIPPPPLEGMLIEHDPDSIMLTRSAITWS